MNDATGRTTVRRKRKRWKLTPRFWAVVVGAFLLYMTISYVSGFVEIWKLQQEIRRVQEQIAEVEARNAELRKEIEYLQSDEYIEKVAREELGLVKPGETAVIVASPPEPGEDAAQEGTTGP